MNAWYTLLSSVATRSTKANTSEAPTHAKKRAFVEQNKCFCVFFFSSRRRHTRFKCDWSSDVCSSDLTKVEPPTWWAGLTPEVLLLLSGHDLEATHVECNLPTLRVSRTQATAGGNYLFVWLKIGADTKSGTAVCRIAAPKGTTSFELPIVARAPTLGKFQGLSQNDVMYLVMPDRFANDDPTNDDPAEAPGSHDRSNPPAYHGGDLRGIQNHLPYLKDLGVTALCVPP